MQPSTVRRIVKLLPRDYVDSRTATEDGLMTPAGLSLDGDEPLVEL
jgi:hypothetical protein